MNTSLSSQRRVKTGLILQNCYLRDVVPAFDVHSSSNVSKSYVDLTEQVVDDGVKVVESVVPYEITPAYVKSFAEGVDYRKDPESAVSNSRASGVNLGDLTALQELLSMSPEQLSALVGRFSISSSAKGEESSSVKSDVGSNLESDAK